MRFGAIIRRVRHFSSKLRTKKKERLDVENAFPKRGLEVLKSFRESSKFDESVDVALRLNLDPRKPNQAVRKQVRLPHGTSSLCLQMVKFVEKKSEFFWVRHSASWFFSKRFALGHNIVKKSRFTLNHIWILQRNHGNSHNKLRPIIYEFLSDLNHITHSVTQQLHHNATNTPTKVRERAWE